MAQSKTECCPAVERMAPADLERLVLKHVDPYAVWALWTGVEGLATALSKGCRVETHVLVVLELRKRLPGDHGPIKIQKGYPFEAKYVTGVIRFDKLHCLLDERRRIEYEIQRFELGMLVDYENVAIPALQRATEPAPNLNVVAIVDYGFPFAHEHFQGEGFSRVRYFWDQGRKPNRVAPDGAFLPSPAAWRFVANSKTHTRESGLAFNYGAELRSSGLVAHALPTPKVDIEDLFRRYRTPSGTLDEEACYESIGYTLMREPWTHGAHVADIAAGWPDPLNPRAAPPDESGRKPCADEAGKADIIFVQFPEEAVGDTSGGSMNAFALDAIRYIEQRTKKDARVVVNMSYGTFAGPHDGTSLLEKGIDEIIASRCDAFDVVLPAGNSFSSACHSRFSVSDRRGRSLHLEVMSDDPTDSFVELWYPEIQELVVTVSSPDGDGNVGPVAPGQTRAWLSSSTGEPLCTVTHVIGASGEYDLTRPGKNCVLIAVSPTQALDCPRSEAPHGVWNIKVENRRKGKVTVDAWVERDDPALRGWGGRQSRFIVDPQDDDEQEHDLSRFERKIESATKFGTLNTYATGERTKVVGGCRVDDYPNAADRRRALSLARYTSAGFEGADKKPHAGGPDLVAPSDRRQQLEGRLAAGTRTGHTARMNGTSVAAPQYARALMNTKNPSVKAPPHRLSELHKARWGKGVLEHPPSDE